MLIIFTIMGLAGMAIDYYEDSDKFIKERWDPNHKGTNEF
jgi:hypothetical protein